MRAAKRMCNIDATRSALRSPPKIFCGQAAPWPSLAAGCCLFMTLVLLGVSTPSCAASSGDIVSTYDKDGDGLLNAGEIEHLMVAVLKRPDERAACPNASSLLSSRDIDGDQKLDSTEMEGVSWDFLQCRPTRDAMMSAGEAIVTTSTGSYACAAEHHRDEHHEDEAYEREPADKSDGDEHAEEEVGHGDGHGDGRGGEHLDDSAVSLTFPGGIPVTWHCKPTEGHGEPEEEEDSVKNSVSERWGLAILASILISLISLVGVILLTCVTNFAQHSLHHASDYMSSLAVGAIISLIFTHLLPEAAEGDKDGRFAWRTGTAVLGGIMTGYLLKSLVRCVRTCMGIHSHECGVVCADLPVFTAPEKQGVKKAAPRQPASLPMGHPVLLEEDEGAKCVTHGGEDSLPAGTGQKMTAIEVQDKAGQEAPGPVGTMCHSHDDTHEHRPSLKHRMTMRMVSVKSVAFAILLGDLVCNLVDGLVIGVSFSLCGTSAGWAVTAAIVLHEIPQELSDFVLLRRAGLSLWTALGVNLASAMSCILGAIVGLATAKISSSAQSVLASYSVGILIFVALVDIFPELMRISEVHTKWMAVGHVAKRFSLIILGAVAVGLTALHDKHCGPDAHADH